MITSRKVLWTLALSMVASFAEANDHLVVTYDSTNYGYTNPATALINYGHGVDTLAAANAGDLATALGTGNYTNVFIWDLGGAPIMNVADKTALATWYSAHKSIVLDGRSYGSYYSGVAGAEGKYLDNVSNVFTSVGGGLWIGYDDSPNWTPNANPALAAINMNQATGQTLDNSLAIDGSNPIMAGVTASGLTWNWSAGYAPSGLQPNGQTLTTIGWNGSGESLISTSIVPEPASLIAISVGIVAICRRRRRSF